MSTPTTIHALISRFQRDIDEYKSGRYNETQARQEFIDPLFEALGWDIGNKRGSRHAQREVVLEYSQKIGSHVQAPDYLFRTDNNHRFFVEAKRPSVNLKDDTHPAFQLRRYAWSAQLPFSVLTDFEEFAIYDCRIAPDQNDDASVARLLYVPYTHYSEKWDDIASLFSREAVLSGSLEKFAETKKAPKGTTPVDIAFLKEVEQWRELLARNIAMWNDGISQRELNYAVQMTIDRIIFLRICEDRGIEPYGHLQELLTGAQTYDRLCTLFRAADDRYNSGLFHFQKERGRTSLPDDLTLKLYIQDEPLKKIVKKLYYPNSPYEFSVIPVEVLGKVYEQFLGKVITVGGDRKVTVEEKPEVRKAGGVYYTPAYIVDYIVKNTVGKLLEGKTLKEAAKLRIIDPAAGSGSFLIGAYQYLLDWHRDQYLADGSQKHCKKLHQVTEGDWRLTIGERKRILLNSIYGVDLDAQAVEVSKLSLCLKMLEGENEHSLGMQLRMFQERVLSDLDTNIKCGNSLIATDFYDFQQSTFLTQEEQYRVNAFDWKVEFPEIMDAGGFDAVIGNPPYIRIQRIGHSEADYIFRKYLSPTSKTDVSLVFLEKGLSLTKQRGLVGFISTSQWLSTDYGQKMREMLSDGRLTSIVDFGSLPVFENADTYPAIFILSPTPAEQLIVKRIQSKDQLNLVNIEQAAEVSIPLQTLSREAWILSGYDLHAILKRENITSKPFSHFGNAYIGVLTGMDAVFVVSSKVAQECAFEQDILLPYAYRGAEVHRYDETNPDARVIYPYRKGEGGSPELIPETELKSLYPNVYQHLLQHKAQLRTRMDSRKLYADGSEWYRHLRPGSFRYIDSAKFIIKGVDTKSSVGILREATTFNGANCPGIIIERAGDYNPLYILALLNSRIISYYLKLICPPKLGGYTRFNASNIANIPIRMISFSNAADKIRHNQIAVLVERILSLNNQLGSVKTSQEKTVLERQIEATDRQIDALVYDLYGLTKDERAMVEAATR